MTADEQLKEAMDTILGQLPPETAAKLKALLDKPYMEGMSTPAALQASMKQLVIDQELRELGLLPPKLVWANIESCEENDSGATLTLYFEGTPTTSEVKDACRRAKGLNSHLGLGVDPDDKFFGWAFYPNPVSTKAGLIRVQAFPAG